MLKQFFKDSLVYGAANIAARGVSILLLPFYTRVLSPSDYGMIDVVTVLAALVNVTITLEITQGIARFYPDAEAQRIRVAYASTALWFTIASYAAFATLGLLFSTPLSIWILEAPGREAVFHAAVFAICGQGLFYFAQNQLRWLLRPKLYAVASLAYTGVSIPLSVVFVLLLDWGVIGIFHGQLVGALVGSVFALYAGRESYQFTFSWLRFREMVRFSGPIVPSSLGVVAGLYIDRVAIKELMTIADVGVFGIGYRLASLVTLLMVGFQGALTPLIYTHYRDEATPSDLARIFRYFSALALLVSLTLSLFASELLLVFATAEYSEASVVVPLLVPATLLAGMYIFAPGLAIRKKMSTFSAVNIVGAVMNTILNFVLIPPLGIRGAALATLISAATTFSVYMYFSQRLYVVPHRWSRLGAAVLVAISLFLGATLIAPPFWLNIAFKAGLVCFAASTFVFLGLVQPAEIRGVLNRARHRLTAG